MSEPKKRFGRSRKSQDDTQDFALTERDRELAALAAEILPRNSAAASFERSAARKSGSSAVSTKDAATDHGLADDAAAPGTADASGDTAAPAGKTASGGKGRAGKKRAAAASVSASGTAVANESGMKGARAGTSGADASGEAGSTDEPGVGTSDTSEDAETPAARKKLQRDERRRAAKAAKAEKRERRSTDYQPTPLWYKVVMIGLMILGLLWIITYYLFQGMVPIPGISVWNLVIGLGFMLAGLIMTTRWR